MDDDQLRRNAATRPGYATYPTTRPGNPSWWRRPVDGTTGRPLRGHDVARLASRLGVPISPWQVRVIDDALRTPPCTVTVTLDNSAGRFTPADPGRGLTPAARVMAGLDGPESKVAPPVPTGFIVADVPVSRWRRWLDRWRSR